MIMLLSLLILGLEVKTVKDHYYTGTENLTLIGINDKVILLADHIQFIEQGATNDPVKVGTRDQAALFFRHWL